jgi:hypothetical protein
MKTLNRQRTIALGTLGVLGATVLGGSSIHVAEAKSSTWKKVAIGAAAVTGYGLLKKNKKVAIVGGLATAGSYYKYKSDKKKEDRERDNRYRYGRRYRR